MSEFIIPGVQFERIPNQKYAIIPGGAAEVAFVGTGKLTLTQESTPVVRGANWTAGYVTSDLAAAVATAADAFKFNINLNGDGLKVIDLETDLTNGLDIAADIQAKVRQTVPTDGNNALAYSAFTCTFNSTDVSYTLTSGMPGTSSSIVVTVGATDDILADLKLDAAVPVAGTAPNDTISFKAEGAVIVRYGSATYQDGVDYTLVTDPDPLVADEIQWVLGHGPSYGITYYVTGETPKVDSDFGFKTFYALDEVLTAYGEIDSVNGYTLPISAQAFFANGGVKLNCVQMKPTGSGGTAYLQSDYTDALAKLELEEIDILVPLLTQDSTFTSLFSLTKEHVYRMSQPSEGRNRMAFLAPSVGTTMTEYKSYAASMALDRIVLTAPSSFLVTVDNEEVEMAAYFANAAMAGFLADPDNIVSEPLTRKELFGATDVGTKYTKSQMRDLIGSGVLVVENAAGILRVVHGTTTDRTLIDTSEISLVRVSDFFGKTLKNILDTSYIGSRIDVTTLSSIRGTITLVVDNFVTNGALIGMKSLTVEQDTGNPTLINVAITLQPVYPLNFIDIKFTLEL